MHSIPLTVTTDPDIVRQLIAAGVNVNQTLFSSTQTPLLFFMSRWSDPIPKATDLAIMKGLLDAGAQVNVHGAAGDTPLHVLAIKESDAQRAPEAKALLGYLLNAGASIDARDGLSNATPLMIAVRLGHYGITELLLDHGASLNLQDASGNYPEAIAAQEHDQMMSYILLQYEDPIITTPVRTSPAQDCISGSGWMETWDPNYIHSHDHGWTITTWSNAVITLVRDDGKVDGTLQFNYNKTPNAPWDYFGSLVDHKPPDAGQYTNMTVVRESCSLLKVDKGWWLRRGGALAPPIISTQPEWQIDVTFCLNDQGSSGRAYQTTCDYGDQFGAVLACQRGNAKATAAIEAAGRTAVNDYLAPVQPSHCHKSGALGTPRMAPSMNRPQQATKQHPLISVNVENASVYSHSFDIHDNVCATDSRITLAAGETRSTQFCSNEALTDGYASFKVKYSENSVWTNFDQIRVGKPEA